MHDESQVHTLLKVTRRRAPHLRVTHHNPLGSAKATNPKDLLMVLAQSMGSDKGHVEGFDG